MNLFYMNNIQNIYIELYMRSAHSSLTNYTKTKPNQKNIKKSHNEYLSRLTSPGGNHGNETWRQVLPDKNIPNV